MSDKLELPYSDFLARTSVIRRWLILEGDERPQGFSPEMAANVRAWAIVWMGAASESFWRPFLQAVCEEFAQSSLLIHRRNMRAQSIFFMDQIFSDVTRDLERRWEKSFLIMESIVSLDRRTSSVTIPYDGKTVRPIHIKLLWDLFQIPGDPFPSMIHKQSLETLANDRNIIAHGEQMPSTIGRLRTKVDVMLTLARLEETVERTYLETRALLCP